MQEHLHLEWDLVNLSQVLLDRLNTRWKHLIAIAIDPFVDLSDVIPQADPRIKVRVVYAQVRTYCLRADQVFLREEDWAYSSILHLLEHAFYVDSPMMLESEQTEEDLPFRLTLAQLLVDGLVAVFPMSLKHLLYVRSHRLIGKTNRVKVVRVPLLHKLFDCATGCLCDRDDLLAIPEICAILKNSEGFTSAE